MSKNYLSEINIIYDTNKEEKINIFGSKFVRNNKNKCKMIIENNEYELAEEYNVENNNNNILKIKLKEIDKITDMSYMFDRCSSLLSLPDISNWNTNNVTNMSCMFWGCKESLKIPPKFKNK